MNSSPVSLLLLLFLSPRAPLGTVSVQFSDLDIAYYYYLNKVQLHSSKFDFAVGWCRTSFTSITSMPWWLLWSPPLQAGDWAYRGGYFISWKFLSRRSVIQLDSSGEEEDTYNGEWEQGNNSEWLKRYLWTVHCVYEGQQWRNRMHINTIQSHFLEETEQTELRGTRSRRIALEFQR